MIRGSLFFYIPACVVLCCVVLYVMCVVSMSLSYLDPEFPLGINKVINKDNLCISIYQCPSLLAGCRPHHSPAAEVCDHCR